MAAPDTFLAVATTDIPALTGQTAGLGTVEALRVDHGSILNGTGETFPAANPGHEAVLVGDVVLCHTIDGTVIVQRVGSQLS